jgi:integrase/recombinase XerD
LVMSPNQGGSSMSGVSGLAVQAAAFMGMAGYSPGSRINYQRVWAQFGEYCAESGVRSPDRETAARFCTAVDADGAEQWQVFYRRAVGCLFDVAEMDRFALRAGRGRIPVPEVFTAQFDVYAAWLAGRGLAEVTMRGKNGMLRRFLAFLAGLGVREVAALRVADVSTYVRSLAPMAASSRAGQLYFLREYLRFAVGQHGADPALGAMFPVIVTDRDAVLPSVYRPGEIAGALTEAGNGSESPLRDRAVMLLASLLGLRSGDIKGLRFDQIDWANRRLSLVQHKTGRRLDLPLPQECALAIIDYWKNERPEVGDPQVFLRHRAPHQPPVAGNHFHQVVAGCFARAGVEVSGRHRGLHALRHSAANGMLESGVPYPVIGAVLGHADANTTRRYLRVDVAHLRPLALEVPDGR